MSFALFFPFMHSVFLPLTDLEFILLFRIEVFFFGIFLIFWIVQCWELGEFWQSPSAKLLFLGQVICRFSVLENVTLLSEACWEGENSSIIIKSANVYWTITVASWWRGKVTWRNNGVSMRLFFWALAQQDGRWGGDRPSVTQREGLNQTLGPATCLRAGP